MKNYFILFAMLFVLSLSACSIPKEPRLAFGKKCVEKNSDIVYSYVWLYDGDNGLPASEGQCWPLADKK